MYVRSSRYSAMYVLSQVGSALLARCKLTHLNRKLVVPICVRINAQLSSESGATAIAGTVTTVKVYFKTITRERAGQLNLYKYEMKVLQHSH